MTQATFIPLLQPNDIQHAIMLITESYTGQVSVEDQRRYQWELFEVQKKYEAWGLVIPLLDHPDPNVQFFGAHTAQVKIVRDWESFHKENAVSLKDMLLELICKAITSNKSKAILRKLYVAISQLALKIHPTRPSQWPDWILATITYLSGHGASPEQLLEFLAIVPEEIRTSDLINSTKTSMNGSLTEAVPMVIQAITNSITNPSSNPQQIQTALQCLEKWIAWGLPASDLTPLIPLVVSLLSFEESFVAASDTLQEILTSSSLADGSGNKTLTEPLLDFMSTNGRAIYERSISQGFIDDTSHSLCKLLCALGDHSVMQFAATLPSRSTQTYLRLMLDYTGLPGWFGVDEEASDICLPFWYLLQESLWTVEFVSDREPGKESEGWERSEEKQWEVAAEVYTELVDVLRRKVVWPRQEVLSQWSKDQVDKFTEYRRDVGDIFVNAYYVLRDKAVDKLVSAVRDAISADEPQSQGWENIEATLHCIMCTQEAIPLEQNPALKRLFEVAILEKISSAGTSRVRRTMIQLIGEYATWFTTLPAYDRTLMDVVGFVVAALRVPSLCFPAANALKELCDANRSALAPHIAAFGDLHSGIVAIPETEKGKILQSIASVIGAVPPRDAIQAVEAIINPVLEKLAQAITMAGQLPEDARNLCIQQLRALTGCARGLINTSEPVFVLGESNEQPEGVEMSAAREDPRAIKLRRDILLGLESAMQLWSTDVETADALSDLLKAITCLPSDVSLISLPPGPLLELTCTAAQRRLTSVWLSLAGMLMGQLCPPSLTTLSLGPSLEAENLVLSALPMLLEPCFVLLNSTEAMEANPDIAQSLFSCMEMVTHHFTRTIHNLPAGTLTTLILTSIGALAVQERYALVSACAFLMAFIRLTLADGNLSDQADTLMDVHGKAIVHAILSGFVGVAPRSTLPNLIDLLALIALKRTEQCPIWMRNVLFSSHFTPSQATPNAKENLLRAVASARSTKRIRDASNQFALIARGLEGSGFGYATVTI